MAKITWNQNVLDMISNYIGKVELGISYRPIFNARREFGGIIVAVSVYPVESKHLEFEGIIFPDEPLFTFEEKAMGPGDVLHLTGALDQVLHISMSSR